MDSHTAREWRRFLSAASPSPPKVERGKAPPHALSTVDVTILITLYNYDRYIGPCLRSAVRTATVALQEGVNCEILVIDDRSTDLSRHIVRRFLCRESRIPIELLCKGSNTGLASTRNLGIRHARGKYVMILDADNILLPNCIPSLFSLAEAERCDAVYPVIQRFKDETGELDGLLSEHPFDPERLVQANYIDAMALFRVDTLSTLEGYDEEMSYGWEDYELWLKMAFMQRKILCAGRILALYRVKESSMLITANTKLPRISRYLRQKYSHHFRRLLFGKERRFGLTDEEINADNQASAMQELATLNATLQHRIDALEAQLAQRMRAHEALLNSRTWKATRPLREFLDGVRRIRRGPGSQGNDPSTHPVPEHR